MAQHKDKLPEKIVARQAMLGWLFLLSHVFSSLFFFCRTPARYYRHIYPYIAVCLWFRLPLSFVFIFCLLSARRKWAQLLKLRPRSSPVHNPRFRLLFCVPSAAVTLCVAGERQIVRPSFFTLSIRCQIQTSCLVFWGHFSLLNVPHCQMCLTLESSEIKMPLRIRLLSHAVQHPFLL